MYKMSKHGLRGFQRLVMKNDAETIGRTNLVPVLLVKAQLSTAKTTLSA